MMRAALTAFGLVAMLTSALRAQDPAMARAFELERRGNYAAAVDAYRAVLAVHPADVAALLRQAVPMARQEGVA